MQIEPRITLFKKKKNKILLQVEEENLIRVEGRRGELANGGQVLGELPPYEFVNAP